MTGRLLYVVNNASFFLSHRLPLALAAREAGWDVHVATPMGPAVKEVEGIGLPWHSIQLSRSGVSPVHELGSLADLVRLYRRLAPDLVHHVTSKPVIYGTLAASIAQVPGVVNAVSGLGHAFSPGAPHLLRAVAGLGYRVALRHQNMVVIFQNPEHQRKFVEARWVDKAHTILVPGSGVDVKRFRPVETASDSEGELTVVLAARLLATKGVREFVQAARTLRASGSARFVLVGEPDPGNPASIPTDEIARWLDEGVIEYWGFRSDMADVYASAHIACLPSHTEGMPKSLIEAAACALPIVASDEPGCRAVVTDGESGLLVPVADASALAAALGRLLGDSALRSRLGAEGRRRAVDEFAVEHIVSTHLRIYDELSCSLPR